MIKNVRMIELVGSVIQSHLPRRPTRRGHQGVVLGDGLRVVGIEVGDVDFAARASDIFESDFRPGDAFVLRDSVYEVVSEGVRLPPQ